VWLLQRLRLTPDVSGVKVLAIEVKFRILCPGALEKLQPLGCVFVAVVVGPHLRAEHVKLVLEPATDYVECKSSVGDVIDRRRHLGHHERMHERYMTGGQYGNVLGHRAERRGPGKALKCGGVEVGWSAISTPATHG
jgi:hypothetical protein